MPIPRRNKRTARRTRNTRYPKNPTSAVNTETNRPTVLQVTNSNEHKNQPKTQAQNIKISSPNTTAVIYENRKVPFLPESSSSAQSNRSNIEPNASKHSILTCTQRSFISSKANIMVLQPQTNQHQLESGTTSIEILKNSKNLNMTLPSETKTTSDTKIHVSSSNGRKREASPKWPESSDENFRVESIAKPKRVKIETPDNIGTPYRIGQVTKYAPKEANALLFGSHDSKAYGVQLHGKSTTNIPVTKISLPSYILDPSTVNPTAMYCQENNAAERKKLDPIQISMMAIANSQMREGNWSCILCHQTFTSFVTYMRHPCKQT